MHWDKYIKDKVISFERANNTIVSLSILDGDEELDIIANKQIKSASLIKLFILGSLVNSILKGEFSYSDKIYIKASDIVQGSGLIKYCNGDTALRLKDLIFLMLNFSDNTATNKIIDLLSKEKVQDFIKATGAQSTFFVVPMMNGDEDLYNITSAKDVTIFYRSLITGFKNTTFIHNDCANECLRLLNKYTNVSFLKYSLSYLFNRLFFYVLINNPQYLKRYYFASHNRNNKRLTVDINSNKIIAIKSGTGRTIFHDSCILRHEDKYKIIAMLIESSSSDFANQKSDLFINAMNLSKDIGSYILN